VSAAPRADAPGLEMQAIAGLLRRAGSSFESEVRGSSMEPTIPDGALIRIGPPPSGDYRVGDVVACVRGEALFAHRIVYRDPAGDIVLTRGDGWILCDPPVQRARIVGAVREYLDGGAWRAPAVALKLGGWRERISRLSYWLVRGTLPIHPEVARRVSGTMLCFGALCKRIAGTGTRSGNAHPPRR